MNLREIDGKMIYYENKSLKVIVTKLRWQMEIGHKSNMYAFMSTFMSMFLLRGSILLTCVRTRNLMYDSMFLELFFKASGQNSLVPLDCRAFSNQVDSQLEFRMHEKFYGHHFMSS